MGYAFPEVKSFKGLYIQPNSFALPDGALEICDNCVINQDGVINKRRGFFNFSPALGGHTLNNLFFFQNTILALYNDEIAWVDTSGTQTVDTTYTGFSVALTGGRIGRSVEANSNFYFTSDNGVLKLEAFNGTVQTAGVPPALDLRARVLAGPGPIGGNTEVQWRVTFGRVDSNGNLLESAPSDIAVVTINDGVTHNVNLEFSIPSEIQDVSYFWRVYRSSQSISSTTAPAFDFKLIKQLALTPNQLSSRVVFFTDTILDIFQASAAELYTNPNSQEGELQAAARPPLAQDVAFYKNHTFYANTTSRQSLDLAMVSTDPTFIVQNDRVSVKLGGATRTYIAASGVGNTAVAATTVTGTSTIVVTYNPHGFTNGTTIYVSNVTGTVPEGIYTITFISSTQFSFVSTGNTASALDFQGIVDGTTGQYMFQLVPPGGSPSVALDATARALVKAINRDPSSLIYARYASAGLSDIPGKMHFEAKGFGAAFSFDVTPSGAPQTGQAFSPVLPTSFSSGTQVTSTNDVQPNVIFSSKIGEPESVPIVNTLPIGSKNKAILRVVALRDCCIVIKQDGIFRIDGDAVTNFVSTILDSTVFCLVPSSVGLIDNTVMMLSNQGVVKISSSAVQIVSYKIELAFRAVIGSANLIANTSAVTYESERLYLLTTLAPNTTTASVVYCYHTLSDTWTTWNTFFKNGIVGPNDTLQLITLANNIAKERKNQNKTDYCEQDYPTSVISVAADNLSAVISSGSIVPQPNDILVFNNVINRLKTVVTSGPNYAVTFYQVTNLVAGNAPTLYSQYMSTIKFAPFHAGQVNRVKHFAQFQVHLRDAGASLFTITFSNDTFGSSESIDWSAIAVSAAGGWGGLPWGLFPWGLDQGINLTYTTQPGPIVRTYVPKFAARSTFIQAQLVHSTAGERISIQEISYAVRAYGERVSK